MTPAETSNIASFRFFKIGERLATKLEIHSLGSKYEHWLNGWVDEDLKSVWGFIKELINEWNLVHNSFDSASDIVMDSED